MIRVPRVPISGELLLAVFCLLALVTAGCKSGGTTEPVPEPAILVPEPAPEPTPPPQEVVSPPVVEPETPAPVKPAKEPVPERPKVQTPTLVPPKPEGPYFAKFDLEPAPQTTGPLLRKGDRLAICGDSITEQLMYSRAIETYLTVCTPSLGVEVRQFGWGGETAGGFLSRMTNDCLRFGPTIATTCYGMNDHGYQPFDESIASRYRQSTSAIVKAFKSNQVRVLLGAPGCVGARVLGAKATPDEMNLSLCQLRNIDVEIALRQDVAFADVFWTMLRAGYDARRKYGTNYAIAGVDGVHPGWSGSFVMAYTFLRGLGLRGDIGRFTVDYKRSRVQLSDQHEMVSYKDGELVIQSARYPFCATGEVEKDSNIRSAMSLVPFNSELNRLLLVVDNLPSHNCKITWGGVSRTYTDQQLTLGVNLAEDYPANPFLEAFTNVDRAVAAKQAYETKQIKSYFRSPEAFENMPAVVTRTEQERARLVTLIHKSFVPVTHTIRIEPL